MSETLKCQDKLGAVLVQVQHDLKQLRCHLHQITVNNNEPITGVDIQALDNAIRRTERNVRKHTEDYLKAVTSQLLVLPSIEDVQKKSVQIPIWKPVLETPPKVHPRGEDHPWLSSREKPKSMLTMHLLCNSTHPKNRAILYQKCGISLPNVHRKCTNATKHPKIASHPAQKLKVFVPRSQCNLSVIEADRKITVSKSRLPRQLNWEIVPRLTREKSVLKTPKTPPPTTTMKNTDHQHEIENTTSDSHQITPVPLPVNTSKYPFTITNGRIDPMAADFCRFQQSFSSCWGVLAYALEALEKLLRDFAVPVAKVSGDRLVEFAHGWDSGWRKALPVIHLLSLLENSEEVRGLVLSPGQRYKGEGGIEAAAIHIQSCWRGFAARKAYRRLCRRKWAAGTIGISWLLHTQMNRVRKALQARRSRQLENYRSRAQNLAANWKHIQSSKRTIIHIPSLGYAQSHRLNLRGFDVLQNVQMSRLCDIRDKNVEVIYVCPRHLGEDTLDYYNSLLMQVGAREMDDNRNTEASLRVRPFVILTPEAVDYFPDRNMCLSTLLKYSPHTLKRIKNLIQGKEAYIVGGIAQVDDLAVADELGVPILGPEPAVVQLYSTKSGGRRIFTGAEVDVAPGQGDIYSLKQLHQALAQLMTQNLDVQRWLFKMDSEHSGHGTAYCDTRHLSCHTWAVRHRCDSEAWNTKDTQESVLLRFSDEIPQWLTRHAQPAKTSCYPDWTCFLKTFLRQGGVVEACAPSDGLTCLTVDLLLEPGGEVTMLSCGDQLHGSCQLQAAGSSVPQTSVHPETLHSICTRVGQACLQRHIVGYVSVDLAAFPNGDTTGQKVWAVDLDLRYSDQLAMTQMLLMMTGGSLNCRSGSFQVPVQISRKSSEHQIADKPRVVDCCAVLGSNLFHSNLFMLYHNVFFKMCKAHGIGFNVQRKHGTMFALYDSTERCSIGMITVSEDLRGALVTFARNLSIIHGEISSSKMHEETNFKVLIKNIEDLLKRIVQRKLEAVKDKPAA